VRRFCESTNQRRPALPRPSTVGEPRPTRSNRYIPCHARRAPSGTLAWRSIAFGVFTATWLPDEGAELGFAAVAPEPPGACALLGPAGGGTATVPLVDAKTTPFSLATVYICVAPLYERSRPTRSTLAIAPGDPSAPTS